VAVEDYLAVRSAIRSLADPQKRPVAKALLVDYGAKAVPPLIRALEGPDADLACAAAQVLGEIGDPRAIGPLSKIVMHQAPQIATDAVVALGHFPDPKSLAALDQALHSEHPTVRLEAALGLAQLSSEPSGRALEALGHLHPDDVSRLCRSLLEQLGPRARESAFSVALQVNVEAAVGAVLAALEARQAAPSALDLLRRPEVVRPLLARLTRATATEIVPILAFLGQGLRRPPFSVRDPRIAQALDDMARAMVRLLPDVDADELGLFLEALQSLGSQAIVPLRQRLIDGKPEERSSLAQALKRLNWSPTPDEAGARYWIALGDLSRCAHAGKEAITPLLEEFKKDDPDRRDAAAIVLRRLGWKPEGRESRLLSLIALHRWQVLALMGQTVVPTLIAALRVEHRTALAHLEGDHRAETRVAMVQTLGQLAGRASADALVEVIRSDPSQKVRAEAQLSLERLRNEGLLALVRSLQTELDLATSPSAAQSLSPQERSVRVAARGRLVRALARMADLDAIEVLLRTVGCDPTPATRAAASDAIHRLSLTAPEQVAEAALASVTEESTLELGNTLRRLGKPVLERLLVLITSSDDLSVRKAIAAYVAMGHAGADVASLLVDLLLSGSAQARLAVTQVLDQLEIEPEAPKAWAAYWLAKGDLDRCEALGNTAVPVLVEALSTFEWKEAGAIARSLVRLGLRPDDPALETVMADLRRMSGLQDEIVTQVVEASREGRPDRQPVVLAVSHREERQAARKLLAAIDHAWAEQLRGIRRQLEW